MVVGNGESGVSISVVVVVIITIIVVAAGGGYYLVTSMGHHSTTGSHTESTIEGTSASVTSQNSTTTSPIVSTSSATGSANTTTTSVTTYASSTTPSSATSSNFTLTSQSAVTYPPVQLGMIVNETILDQAQAYNECGSLANCTSVIYIFNMTVTNTGTQNYTFNDLYLQLRTSAEKLYGTDEEVYAIQSPANGHARGMPMADVQPGDKLTGEEGFEVPSNETPSQLVYSDPYSGVNASAGIPLPTSWVSEVTTAGVVSIAPSYLSCEDASNSQEELRYTASYEGLNGSVLGSSDYFTGEIMAFSITITLGKGVPIPSPGTVMIHTDVAQFNIVKFTAPECVGGSEPCTNWTVDVYIVAQQGLSYYGDPSLTVVLQPS